MANRCRYCWVEIPEFVDPDTPMKMVVEYRLRADILTSSDLWAPEETIEAVTTGRFACFGDNNSIPVRVRVDPRRPMEFCSETHRRAMAGNKTAVREALGEFRADGEGEPEPTMVHPDQGSLL